MCYAQIYGNPDWCDQHGIDCAVSLGRRQPERL